MQNLQEFNIPFHFQIKELENGNITEIRLENKFSYLTQINLRANSYLAFNIYNKSSYTVGYIEINILGEIVAIWEEKEGILPSFFHSPDHETWVSVMPYHPDKDQNINIPIYNRENIEYPKPKSPIVGDFIGIIDNSVIIYCNNYYKPIKFHKIDFLNGKIKSQKSIKLDKILQKSYSKGFINSQNEFHAIALDEFNLYHYQFDLKGILLRERALKNIAFGNNAIIELSFENKSLIIHGTIDGKIASCEILPNGEMLSDVIYDLKHQIYSMNPAIFLYENTYLISFVYEKGNGWLIMKDRELIEIFISESSSKYRNLLDNNILEIEDNEARLFGVNKTIKNGFCMTFINPNKLKFWVVNRFI